MLTRTWPRFGTSRNGSFSFSVSIELIFSRILFQFFFQIEKLVCSIEYSQGKQMFRSTFKTWTIAIGWYKQEISGLKFLELGCPGPLPRDAHKQIEEKKTGSYCKIDQWNKLMVCHPALKRPKPSDWYTLRFIWIITHGYELKFNKSE